jgi:peptidoglycan-N-acetylglucosamine deacetylase
MRDRWRSALGAALAAVLAGVGIWVSSASAAAGPVSAEQTSAAVTDQLLAGQRLSRDEQLVSSNGTFRFVMQGDGNVVLYAPVGALWWTGTFVPGTVLTMQEDGNLVAYAPDGRPVWFTGTRGSGATRLVMQSDGNAVLYRSDGRAVWATNTVFAGDTLSSGQRLSSGHGLVSGTGAYRFDMQGDGNLVLYGPPGGALWASWTFVPGTSLVMQTDGNLVAYAPDGRPVWFTGTRGSGATRLVMQSDGNAVLYRSDGRAVWATWTVRAVPLALRGQDVTVLPTSNHVVALTFDAGANSAGLASILGSLANRNVPASFFLTGQWAAANPAAVADLRARGYRIGNHSMTHPNFTTLSDAAMRQQVLDAERSIQGAGADPRGLFRFPSGDRNAHTIDVVNGLGYVPVRWTVDTLGWRGTSGGVSVQQVVDRALGSLRPGEIVLMHIGSNPDDGSTLDADALPTMIDRMRAAGYGFVTLDALFG